MLSSLLTKAEGGNFALHPIKHGGAVIRRKVLENFDTGFEVSEGLVARCAYVCGQS